MAVLSLSNEPAQPKQVKPEDSLHIDGEMFMNNEPFFDYKRGKKEHVTLILVMF